MGVKIEGSYQGNKRVKLVHEPSGAIISTVAPKDNQGDGSTFSPTDLVAAALGSCMLTLIAIVAERSGTCVDNMRMSTEKLMSTDAPRRIVGLRTSIHLPKDLTDPERLKLENAARTCPVKSSLSNEISLDLKFIYDLA